MTVPLRTLTRTVFSMTITNLQTGKRRAHSAVYLGFVLFLNGSNGSEQDQERAGEDRLKLTRFRKGGG